MALSIPINIRSFMINKGKTIVCTSSESRSARHTFTNASVYAVRLREINAPTSNYINGDRRVVIAKSDLDAVGYYPQVKDIIEYDRESWIVLDVQPAEMFDQVKFTIRRA